ncbi:conserved hypothetical protein [Oceanicaulis sp. 350]|nr:conserved hypothetical protein [Oceanicaulis sp. 350]
MVQGAAFTQRHAHHHLLGFFGRLADGFRHFTRLALSEADAALLVADHRESGELEVTAAFHGFGDAVDLDQLVDQFRFGVIVVPAAAIAAAIVFSCHAFAP